MGFPMRNTRQKMKNWGQKGIAYFLYANDLHFLEVPNNKESLAQF
jgi:hypothetical protein